MKILISGATGFVGRNLVARRVMHNDTIIALTRPSTDISSLSKSVQAYCIDENEAMLDDFFKQEQFDGVIHLATQFLAAHKSSDVRRLIDSNVLFGTQLFEAATNNNVPWIINTSTFTQHFENKDYSAVNLYSATKQAFQDIAQYYAETSKSTIVTITLFDTFGVSDNRSKIMKLLLDAAYNGKHLGLSPGDQILDISPIQNVIDGYDCLIRLLESKDDCEKLNGKVFALPSKERMSLKELVNKFAKLLDVPLDVTFGEREYRTREVMNPWDNCEKVPGWNPKMTLEDGMVKFIQGYVRDTS